MSTRFSPQLRALDFLIRTPIAHRGLHDRESGIVENTRGAFAAALARGYAIECDLQITAEGEAVVFHDEHLDRLTEASGWVKDQTAPQMAQLVIRGSGDRVQTLRELLEQVNGAVPLVIELKSHWNSDDRLVRRALAVLERYTGAYCLMSFDPDMIDAVRSLSPGTVRGIVADRAVDGYYSFLPMKRRLELRTMEHLLRTRPHFMSFYFGELPWAPVTAFRDAGNPVISWTIRSPEQAAIARRYSDQITFERFLA